MEQAHAVRKMWAAGDYATVGDLFAAAGRALVDEVEVSGLDVLDVASGTGNTAMAAARNGGRVTGLDLTPELLDVARERADREGLRIRWIESDMTTLPFADQEFDRVLSTFGAMLAPDPAAMAAELLRVCRPGGLVAVTAWRPDAAYSKLGTVLGQFFPKPDEPMPDPTDWARPERITTFFAGLPAAVTMLERTVTIGWNSVDDAITMLATRCGPVIGAVAALTEQGDWPAAHEAMAEMLAGENIASDGSLTIDMPYLVTIARRSS